MRKSISLPMACLSILVFLLFCCRKPVAEISGAEGDWQWTLSKGGFTGNEIVAPLPGTRITFSFRGDAAYNLYKNGSIVQHGNLRIIKKYGFADILQFDATIGVDPLYMNKREMVQQHTSDSLVLYDKDISEGFSHYFVRLR